MKTQKYFLAEQDRERLLAEYDGKSATIVRLVRELDAPRWRIHKWARQLGVSQRVHHWSAREDLYIEHQFCRMSVADIAAKLQRSENAVRLRAHYLGVNKRSEGYTLRGLCDAMGCGHEKVTRWIRRGWLKASKRKLRRKNDTWYISEAALYDFVCAHPEQINMQRVDQLWLRDVMTGKTGLGVLAVAL